MSADLNKLRRQRASVKAACTRIKNYVDSNLQITPVVVLECEERFKRLEKYWSEYCAIQSDIEEVDDSECADRIQFENAFYALSADLRRVIDSMPANNRSIIAGSISPATDYTHQGHASTVRLPKLNLPSFSGKYEEWFSFHDIFNKIIDGNPSLSNSERFQYLKTSLTGEAADIIDSLEITDENYAVARELLRERYDNLRHIVSAHIAAIFELPSMTRENARDLRHIADGAAKHVRALRALKRPTDSWDDLLIYILVNKLDNSTRREWQASLTVSELPTLSQFLKFLNHTCGALESVGKGSFTTAQSSPRNQPSIRKQAAHVATIKNKCTFCAGEHFIYFCKEFAKLPIEQRILEMRKRKLCTNCLKSKSHSSGKCTSSVCKTCGKKHNTLLHLPTRQAVEPDDAGPSSPDTPEDSAAIATVGAVSSVLSHVMLSTAVVYAYDSAGSRKLCRVLLDCGSQANLISRSFFNLLNLKARMLNVFLSGIDHTTTSANQVVQLKIQSRLNAFSTVISCIVVDRITDKLPSITMKRNDVVLPPNIRLADPQFYEPSDIDVLIGAEVFWQLLCVGQIKSSSDHPTLQKTRFGWILAGKASDRLGSLHSMRSFHVAVRNADLDQQLHRFWQVEEVQNHSPPRSHGERACETHFANNVTRNEDGRFVVKLPIKEDKVHLLGDSRAIALRRFHNLEKRLDCNPDLKSQYIDFMREYLALGHMKRVEELDSPSDLPAFYLPHHCVLKESGSSSKLRVVFDGSCKSSSGTSLNDILMVGPVIQQDLFSIITRFRTFAHVFSADIVKMYRQVLVHESHTRLQRIFWREGIDDNLETYELCTVTYGTASASYLAIKCLELLAKQEASRFPIGSVCVLRDFYVDDILTGADSLREAKEARDQIIALLKQGSFELSKWSSNAPQLLPFTGDRPSLVTVEFDKDTQQILGIRWNPTDDSFQFSFNCGGRGSLVSKRVILSEIASLYDPLGLISPVVVISKLLMQEIWKSNLNWDESVPIQIHSRWSRFRDQLPCLSQLRVPRRVKLSASVEVHGFCDASQDAYGACIYLRSRLPGNIYRIELLCSKSRVAPLKTISLPRLELSAALLLAQLLERVCSSIDFTGVRKVLWSDSTITLNWISSCSRRWTTFVANRVGEIQRLTDVSDWRHVPSGENPADLISRGIEPPTLISSSLWWHGPDYLREEEALWPNFDFASSAGDLPDQRRVVFVAGASGGLIFHDLIHRFSHINKISRIAAYCMRFIKCLKLKTRQCSSFLSPSEVLGGLHALSIDVQRSAFPDEIRRLAGARTIDSRSRLLALSPFLDKDGLLRVGGRLKRSTLPYAARHPILLPKHHRLSDLIIRHEHIRNMHGGVQTTMSAVRHRFWPLSARSTTRRIIRDCVACFKAKPSISEATMADLPARRVEPSRPFSHCGVDYAGPVYIREGRRRNSRHVKAYIAVFVCFAVKAVHLELIGDLTSEAFLGAFKRFISRRGKVMTIHSDNGTAFVGANRLLNELYEFYNSEPLREKLREFFLDSNIEWKFIPPNAPHFGGLWESAVRSAKHHMYRVIGNAHLTFEEMQTLLCEIEAILNSRPLTPLSEDPNDFSCLTPGHFLVGEALNSFPQPDLGDVQENRLSRWQRIEQLRQHFWKRWTREYLISLQERHKWRAPKGDQLKTGQLVLIKQPGLAPLQWLIGRVKQIHPGADGIARTATVRTVGGELVRPLARLAILPIEA